MRDGEVQAWTTDRFARQDEERRAYLERFIRTTKPPPDFTPEVKPREDAPVRTTPAAAKAGDVFGEWTVIEYAGIRGRNLPTYRCRCSCGDVRLVALYALRGGHSLRCRSCANKIARSFVGKARA